MAVFHNEVCQMRVSASEAHNRPSYLLKRACEQPVTITRRGEPVGVLVSPEEYERLRRVQAYLEMLQLSRSLQDSDVTANSLFQTSRGELEAHP
jgi:prevent-host-death family protein